MHASSGITTMTDVTPPRPFVGIQPCRVADTRGNGAPIQGGIFANSEARNWDVTGICGIPAGADAISVNFTVVSAPATPQGAFMLAWPTGSPPSPIVALMTYGPGVTILSNSAIVPLSTGELLTVNVSHSTHVIMDVNGYFSDTLGTVTNQLLLINNISGNYTAAFGNFASATNSSGVVGTAGPGFAHPAYSNAGVRGESQATGVLGLSQTRGVLGSLVSGGGETAFGILGFDVNIADPSINGHDVGVFGYTASTAAQAGAVIGYAPAGSGAISGVRGVIGSQSFYAAGVRGQDGGGPVPLNRVNNWPTSGVRGESHLGNGVSGYTISGEGTEGFRLTDNAEIVTGGVLGWNATVGIQAFGNTAATGTKSFIEPHPTDASKLIRYISLEGNEAGTYFRGREKFQNGIAVIDVPDDFRIVTDKEGLSIQVTPIGQMATVAVESIGLDRIVVRGSRNVEFFYTVNGVRRAYKQYGPIAENEKEFVPHSSDEPMPLYLPEVLKQRLISNGTYRPDGTVNLETARRLGWDKVWEQRSQPEPQPAP